MRYNRSKSRRQGRGRRNYGRVQGRVQGRRGRGGKKRLKTYRMSRGGVRL